jgi:hypothetical protein
MGDMAGAVIHLADILADIIVFSLSTPKAPLVA